jgi:membrane fusion protein
MSAQGKKLNTGIGSQRSKAKSGDVSTPKPRPFFRNEAIAEKQQKYYGRILLVRPASFGFITLVFVAIAFGIILFFSLFGFARKETVQGVLLPEQGLARVYSSQAGILQEVKIQDGQAVKKGDVLFVLSGERNSSRGETWVKIGISQQSRIASMKAELEQQHTQSFQEQASLVKREQDLETQVAQIGNEIALQKKRVDIADATAKRYGQLLQSKFVSEALAQDKQTELLDQQTRLQSLERTKVGLMSDLSNVASERIQQPIKSQREVEGLERAIEEAEQASLQDEAQREFVVLAPRAGVVSGITPEIGQVVSANLALATISPANDKLEAELYAPSRSIGFVKPGTEVMLRYQAFPYEKYGQQRGVVREVSRTPLEPNEIASPIVHSSTSSEPMYRIRVRLDEQTIPAFGQTQQLRAGMQLDAGLTLEHRKLIEWVLGPVFSMGGRL